MDAQHIFQVTTQDPARRRLWLRLFGAEWLPVKADRPRWQVKAGQGEVLAFDLDAKRLHPMARARFAHAISQRHGMTYEAALSLVDGWPIEASGCIVESETAVSGRWQERPFSFGSVVYAG